MNIAIVGCGIGGINLLKTIIDHKNYNEEIKIHVFEKRDELGTGPAYEKGSKYKLLNVAEKHMSLEIGNPNHIYKWIAKNLDNNYQIEGMMPRPYFGDYIKDTYDKYINHPNVTIHQANVVDLLKEEDTYKIETEEEIYDISFDTVFLTIGQSYYRDSYNLKEEENFIYQPAPFEKELDKLNEEDMVGIIGTGPTSIDIYRYIRAYKKIQSPLYFFTRESAFLPVAIPYEGSDDVCSIDNSWIDDHLDNDGFLDLDDVIEQFKADFKKYGHDFLETYDKYKDTDIEKYRKAIEENDQDLAFCQTYTIELWAVAARLYNSLKGLDRIKVDDEYLQKIDFLVTKTPLETMKNIIADYDEGNLKVIRNTANISVVDGKFKAEFDDTDPITVVKIINAQGFEKNLIEATKHDKLVSNLYDRHLIEADRSEKYIRVAYPSYRLVNKTYGLMENIYLSGMWAGSTDILNNDIRSILTASSNIGNHFMSNIGKKL